MPEKGEKKGKSGKEPTTIREFQTEDQAALMLIAQSISQNMPFPKDEECKTWECEAIKNFAERERAEIKRAWHEIYRPWIKFAITMPIVLVVTWFLYVLLASLVTSLNGVISGLKLPFP
jgi:hypothetical protein